MTAYDRLITALAEHGHPVTGRTARCPAHSDHKPSLSITAASDRVLVNCQAGCAVDDVLAAVGLAPVDLFDEPPERNGVARTVAATYDYCDASGTVLYQKVRFVPKDFRLRHPDGRGGWTWGIGNAERVLYRLPEVLAAVRQGATVYIVEGEKDADRLAELGHVATCNFDGAAKNGQRPKWRSAYSDVLCGAHIVVVADNDAVGYAHQQAIAADLAGKAATIRLLRAVPDKPGTDVSDHLDAGHSLDELLESPRLVELPTPTETKPRLARRLRPTLASEVTMRRLRWLWNGRIPLGGLTLLAGREGLGKSILAVELVAQVTRGVLRGEYYGTPHNVIYIPTEDARDFTVVPRMHAAGAVLERVCFLDAIEVWGETDERETSIVLPLDIELLADAVTERNAALVVLDAATSTIDARLDGDKDRQMRQGLEAIARGVAERTGAAVLGIVHFGKRESVDTGKLILGSIAWSQVARSVLAVGRDDETEDLIISATKANLAPADTPSLCARIVAHQVQTSEGSTSVGKVQWSGETNRDARDLLGAVSDDGGERADAASATKWLKKYLIDAGGRDRSEEIKKAAIKAGYPERTLARARRKLTLCVQGEGFPRVTYWSLPEASRASDTNDLLRACGSGTTGTTGPDQDKHGGTTRDTGDPHGTTVAQLSDQQGTAPLEIDNSSRATPTCTGTTVASLARNGTHPQVPNGQHPTDAVTESDKPDLVMAAALDAAQDIPGTSSGCEPTSNGTAPDHAAEVAALELLTGQLGAKPLNHCAQPGCEAVWGLLADRYGIKRCRRHHTWEAS